MLAILAPGQGAQKPGFLQSWLEIGGVAERIGEYGEAAGLDLVAAGTSMSEADITDTAVAQPLIVAASLATATALPALPDDVVLAGHSVGEFAAASLAGVLDTAEAMRLVALRGAAMATAAAAAPSGMTAVLGGDREQVVAAIHAVGCTVANDNGAGQLVAAGAQVCLDRLAAAPPAGARLRPLAVAGAFHTDLMATARAALADAASRLRPGPTTLALLSNRDGKCISDGEEVLRRLVAQVCAPVRWDSCLETLERLGVTATIELAPAGTLTALVRRALPGVTAVALRTPADLDAARDLLADGRPQPSAGLPWRLVVAPTRGTAQLTDLAVDATLAPGDLVVRVATRTDQVAVRTEHGGRLVEWLVHDGDPVSDGQPLARLSAEATG